MGEIRRKPGGDALPLKFCPVRWKANGKVRHYNVYLGSTYIGYVSRRKKYWFYTSETGPHINTFGEKNQSMRATVEMLLGRIVEDYDWLMGLALPCARG